MIEFPGKSSLRASLARTVCRRARCLFVLSTGRCGTTTLDHVLNLCPSIHSEHEAFPLMLAETKNAYQTYPTNSLDTRNYCATFAVTRFRPLLLASAGGPLYAECSNRLTYLAPALAEYFYNARFLFLHRHPGDVVRSAMRRDYYHGTATQTASTRRQTTRAGTWDQHRIQPRPDDPVFQQWSEMSAFEQSCWYWDAVNSFSADFMQGLPAGQGLTVCSDDLFSGKECPVIFRWLDKSPPSDSRIADVLAKPENAQNEGEFPRYSHWSEDQRATLRRYAASTANRLGYDLLSGVISNRT
jgi:hypothetical protein